MGGRTYRLIGSERQAAEESSAAADCGRAADRRPGAVGQRGVGRLARTPRAARSSTHVNAILSSMAGFEASLRDRASELADVSVAPARRPGSRPRRGPRAASPVEARRRGGQRRSPPTSGRTRPPLPRQPGVCSRPLPDT